MTPWWQDEWLRADGALTLDGVDLREVDRTPLYVYSRRAAVARVREIAAHVDRVWYAMKANRHPGLLDALREAGAGADACSPREVALALERGWKPDEISFNAGTLSNRDMAFVAETGVHVTLDSFSSLRRWPRPGPIGLRVDPGVRAGYGLDPKVVYGDAKFGVRIADVPDAVAFAASRGLVVDRVHMHLGWGLQATDVEAVDTAFATLARLARGLRAVNVGGGLGARQRAGDAPLPLDVWGALLRKHLAGFEVQCEPGTFVVARGGVLVCEVVSVERKGDVTWVGLDAGHNVNVYAAHYGIPLEIVPVARPLAPPTVRCNVAGNLNEAGDVFARDLPLPELHEGERVALLPAGAYGATMASDHCLRGQVGERLV
jgi:diaminopimelate decarboxylase